MAGRPSNKMLEERKSQRKRIKQADPIGFLIAVMKGKGLKRTDAQGGTRKVVYPTLEQSITAANTLAKKVAPDLKSVDVKAGDGDGLTFVFQSNIPLPNQGQTIEGDAAIEHMKTVSNEIAEQIEEAVLVDEDEDDA